MAQRAEMKRRMLQRAAENQIRQPQKASQNKNQGTRELNGMIRALEETEDNRRFTLSFSSEEPYMRFFGPEILDHSDGAVDLSRLTDMGVILFNHNRDDVIGKVTRVWIEDQRGHADIEFDDDDMSEMIRKKVESGTLKGVSVGYHVDLWEDVMPGKQSADGRYAGPCSIARKWAPLEISIVSVPADATVGVGREMEEAEEQAPAVNDTSAYETCRRQLRFNENLSRR